MSSLLEAIKNKRQAIAAKSGRERPTRLTSAKNIVRILPRWDGDQEGVFYQDFGQHFIKDKSGKVIAVYICTATTFGQECQVCAEIARHSASTVDEEMVQVLSEARSSSRVLVNAIYRNGTHANAKTDPVLLELPVSVLNDVLGIMETYLEDHDLNLISMAEGYDVVITKTGTGRDTKYTVTPSPKASEVPAEALSKCRNLEDYAKQEYDAGLQKALASLSAVAGGPALPGANGPMRTLSGPSAAPAATPTAEAPTAAQKLASQEPIDMDALEAELEADDVPTPAPAAAPAPAPRKPAPAPAAEIDDDLADLDALLEEATA